MAGVEIRQADVTDKSAVLAIQNSLFDGIDYMEAFFDTFISCPQSTPYVLVYNNEIVSFATAFLVDDANTVVIRGGRTMDTYTGKGFYKMLSQHCQERSGARVMTFTTNNTNKAISSSSFQKEYKHVMSRAFTRFDFDIKDLPIKSKFPDMINILTKTMLERSMTTETYRQYLFPNNRILVNWVPFKLLSSNIPLLWTNDDTSIRLSDVRQENDVMKGLMSITTTHNNSGGIFVAHVDIYGADSNTIQRHLETHMGFVREKADSQAATMVIYCDQHISQLVETAFGKYNITKANWDMNVQILFEKQLQ